MYLIILYREGISTLKFLNNDILISGDDEGHIKVKLFIKILFKFLKIWDIRQ